MYSSLFPCLFPECGRWKWVRAAYNSHKIDVDDMIICLWNDYVYIFVIGRWFWQHDWLLVGQHETDQLHGVCRERKSEAHVLPHSCSGRRLSRPLLLCILAPELMIRSDSWSWFECRHVNGTLYIVDILNSILFTVNILNIVYCGHIEHCKLYTVDMDINCCTCCDVNGDRWMQN